MANPGGSAESLNEHQRRRLLVTCRHVDGMLSEIEAVLNQSASRAAFPKYVPDIPPAQRRTIEDYIARLRAQLKRALEGQEIGSPPPSISAAHAVHVSLQFINVSVEELKPMYMRGYGEVPPKAVIELNGIVGELQGLLSKLDRYLLQGVGHDLQERLRRLEATGNEMELLRKVEEMVARHGLVEFRSTISTILDRAEDKSFEIAVFGRVSCGKSSLLNAILGTDVLPVGVTPITAVPTRIVHGAQPVVRVWFPERPEERFEVSRLGEFVAEQQNPGNTRHVTRIVVELPAPRLRDGIAFVDTPGLGSLATGGAAETLAYLPRCDLGVVLIDAASTLCPEDLRTIEAVYEAAIPANVLLSKADLLNPDDLARVVDYVKSHIASELQIELPVHAVSVMPGYSNLLERWFEEDIAPLYSQRQELKANSIRRKVGALRQSVEAALRTRLRRSTAISETRASELREVEAGLRRTTGRFEEVRGIAHRLAVEISGLGQRAIQEAATSLQMSEDNSGRVPRDAVSEAAMVLARKWTGALRDLLESFSRDVTRELDVVANVLEVADTPTDDEFSSLVREMPVLEIENLQVTMRRPVLASLLGQRLAASILAHRIEKEVGPQLLSALQRYSDIVKDWTNMVLTSMHRRFETYAETYRAQLDRALGGTEPSAESETSIRRDLEELGSLGMLAEPVEPGASRY